MKQIPQSPHDATQQKGVTKWDVPAGEVFLDEDLSPDALLSLWHDFADIPINDWDEIEKPFLHFPAGTYRLDIWRWFDER